MSFEAWRQMLSTVPTRLERIQRIVNASDEATGIVNDSTVCDKAYMENLGPTLSTGTIAAAVSDILSMLTGEEEGSTITIGDNQLVVDDDGVGIGSASSSGYDLIVGTNPSIFFGAVTLGSTLAVTGNLTLDGDLVVLPGGDVNLGDLDITFAEKYLAGSIGDEQSLLTIDTAANFAFENPYDDTDREAIGGPGDVSGAYKFRNSDKEDCIVLDTSRGHGYLSIGEDLNMAVADNPNTYNTDNPGLLVSGLYECSMNMICSSDSSNVQGLNFLSSIDQKGFRLVRRRIGSAEDIAFEDVATDDIIMSMQAEKVWVKGSSGGQNTLQVTGSESEDYEYIKLLPATDPIAIRDNGSGSSTVMEFAFRDDGYQARVGLDSYYENSSFRIHFDDSTVANAVPSVALGKPLGGRTYPIDNLVVMDTPFMTGINCDHLWLNANHGAKEGLWIGRGDGSSTEEAARIWMQDQSGSKSSIMWGTDEEEVFSFMSGGILKATAHATPNNFGGASALGYVAIDSHVSASSFSGGSAAIEAEIQAGVAEVKAGACVLVEDSGGDQELWIVSDDETEWCRITVGANIAVS